MPPRDNGTHVDPAYFRRQEARAIAEAELREWVCDLASLNGWQWRYVRDSRAQNVAGLPDLFLWHEKRQLQIWVELKVERGKLSKSRLNTRGTLIEGQEETIASLQAAGAIVYIWRPSDWLDGDIETVLR